MAKQNFLAGGYYGKLGQTVGQRWKNIRTIRSYVIPRNPRTPKQQANRQAFGSVVKPSQIGMAANFRTPLFYAENRSEWNYRMSTAIALKTAGATGLSLVPLCPPGRTTLYTAEELSITGREDANTIKGVLSGNLPSTDRGLTIVFNLDKNNTDPDNYIICEGIFLYGEANNIQIAYPDAISTLSDAQCIICTRDNPENYEDEMLSNVIDVEVSQIVEVEFDNTIRSVTRSGKVVTITFNEPFADCTGNSGSMELYVNLKGRMQTMIVTNPTLYNNNGYFAFDVTFSYDYDYQAPAFVAGSYVRVSDLDLLSSTTQYVLSEGTDGWTDADLTRALPQTVIQSTASGWVYADSDFAQLEDWTDYSFNVTCADNVHFDRLEEQTLQAQLVFDSTNNRVQFRFGSTPQIAHHDCWFSALIQTIVVNGVTYVLDFSSQTPFSNTIVEQTETFALPPGASSYADETNCDVPVPLWFNSTRADGQALATPLGMGLAASTTPAGSPTLYELSEGYVNTGDWGTLAFENEEGDWDGDIRYYGRLRTLSSASSWYIIEPFYGLKYNYDNSQFVINN